MALTDDLEAYYRLDDNTSDSSENVRHLVGGNVLYSAGKLGRCANGGTNPSALTVSVPFTKLSVSAWFRRSSSLGSTTMVNLVSSAPANILTLATQSSFSLIQISGATGQGTVSVALSLNTWRHVVVAIDTIANTSKVYVDGQIRQTATAPVAATIASWSLGSSATKRLDEVGIWSRELSAAEAFKLYNRGLGFDPTDTSGRIPSELLIPRDPTIDVRTRQFEDRVRLILNSLILSGELIQVPGQGSSGTDPGAGPTWTLNQSTQALLPGRVYQTLPLPTTLPGSVTGGDVLGPRVFTPGPQYGMFGG